MPRITVTFLNEAGFVSKVIELFEMQKAETNKSEKSDAETKKGYDPIPFSPTLPDITLGLDMPPSLLARADELIEQ
jgi:hypothetical protein